MSGDLFFLLSKETRGRQMDLKYHLLPQSKRDEMDFIVLKRHIDVKGVRQESSRIPLHILLLNLLSCTKRGPARDVLV